MSSAADDDPTGYEPAEEATETLVLLGAGASADVGLPTATELHSRLCERLGGLYENLAELVFGTERVDVERLFRIIEFIHAVETQTRPTERRATHDALDLARLVNRWKPALQEYLDSQRHTVKGTPTGSLIDELFSALRQILWVPPHDLPDLRYLRQLLDAMRGGTIVTINYDNALERAANVPAPCPIDAGPIPTDRSYQGPGMANWVRVIKLHGSLNWQTDGPSSDRISVMSDQEFLTQQLANQVTGSPRPPCIIFGAGNKLRPEGPYLSLYSEFKQALDSTRRLIVIGYSFSDAHVNELLRQWVQRQPLKGRTMRIGQLEQTAPRVVDRWFSARRSLELQVVPGPAVDTMADLLQSTPELRR